MSVLMSHIADIRRILLTQLFNKQQFKLFTRNSIHHNIYFFNEHVNYKKQFFFVGCQYFIHITIIIQAPRFASLYIGTTFCVTIYRHHVLHHYIQAPRFASLYIGICRYIAMQNVHASYSDAKRACLYIVMQNVHVYKS